MHQAVRPADVHEDAEVADAGDPALFDVALGQLLQQALLFGGALLLHGCALGEDRAVAAAVQLDDLKGDRPADPLSECALRVLRRAALRAGDDLRQRDEGVDPLDVDEETALVAAGDVAFERFVFVEIVLQHAPAALAAGPVHGEDDLPLRRLRLQDEDEDLVPVVQLGSALRLKAVHLAGRDDSFRLGADVNQYSISVSADDRAFDDLPAPQLRVGSGLCLEKGGHRFFWRAAPV